MQADTVLHLPFRGTADAQCGRRPPFAPLADVRGFSTTDLLETVYTTFAVVAPTLRQTLAKALLTWAIDRNQVRQGGSAEGPRGRAQALTPGGACVVRGARGTRQPFEQVSRAIHLYAVALAMSPDTPRDFAMVHQRLVEISALPPLE